MKTYERLLQARERLALSQEDVAKVLGVTRQTVSKYERGVDGVVPKEKLWAKYERALSKPPGWIWSCVMRDRAEKNGLSIEVIDNYPILKGNEDGQVELSDEIYDLALELQHHGTPALLQDVKTKLRKLKAVMDSG